MPVCEIESSGLKDLLIRPHPPGPLSVGDTKETLHHQNTPMDGQMLSKPQRWAAVVDHHYYQFGSVAVQHRVEPRDCIG